MVGFEEPIKLFTVDLDPSDLTLEEEEPYLSLKERKIKRVNDRMKRDNLRNAAFEGKFKASSLFDTHDDIVKMRKSFPSEFIRDYQSAFDNYVDGHWAISATQFKHILEVYMPNDPLTKNLLKFMSETDFVPPRNWKGYKFHQEL